MELVIILLLLVGLAYWWGAGNMGGVPKLIKTLADAHFMGL